ncbi:MAG TPA: hypothetical protein VHQ90_25555 [Thermoanaerobaculia bacterium]|nr:hypothetical protein [Thermoanaerobaculia bacterium]
MIFILSLLRARTVTLKIGMVILAVYASSAAGLILSINRISGPVAKSPPVFSPQRFDARLDFTAYCKQRYGSDTIINIDSDNIMECIAQGKRQKLTPEEACLWLFGSRANRVEPLSPDVMCDTSRRTKPPCTAEKRFCGPDKDYCCPRLEP